MGEAVKDNVQFFSVVDFEKPKALTYDETLSNSPSAIINYGIDNNLPQELNNLYLNSATLKAVIDRVVDYSCGNGLDFANPDSKWKEVVNSKDETLEEVVQQLFHDFWTYGGFAIQIIYSKLLTISEIYALDFAKCRTNELHSKVLYNRKWGKYTQKGVEYQIFNKERVDSKNPTQILYFTNGSRTVYPLPIYFGSINDIMTDIEGSRYGLNSIVSGFNCRHIIEFLGGQALPDEQKRALEKGIKEKFVGSDAQNFMLYWGSSDNESLKITKIEDDTEAVQKFDAIRNNAEQRIYTAFSASPLLFGRTEGTNTGFSTAEFSDQFSLFNKTVILPAQKKMEKILKKIFEEDIKIKPFTIDIENE